MGDSAAKAARYELFALTGKALASGKRLELLDQLAHSEARRLADGMFECSPADPPVTTAATKAAGATGAAGAAA
jgi:hypothetical protein